MATMSGDVPRRGEIWWVLADKRRPAIVMQTDKVREPRVKTFLVVPLTSRMHLAELPGNVRFSRRVTGLTKDSVANVYDLQKVLRDDCVQRVGSLPASELSSLETALRLVLDL
jgi:mRNA-degrading endonuclease toxin of MazEF toxin-antitoxin module